MRSAKNRVTKPFWAWICIFRINGLLFWAESENWYASRQVPTKACAAPFWPLWSNGSLKGFQTKKSFRYRWQLSGTWCHPFLTKYQGLGQDLQVMLQNSNSSHPTIKTLKRGCKQPLQLDFVRKLFGLQSFAIPVFALSTRTFHVRRWWYRTSHPSCSTAASAACKRDLFATAYHLRSGGHRVTSLLQGGTFMANPDCDLESSFHPSL